MKNGRPMFVRAFSVWMLPALLAVPNGGARETFLSPTFGERAGHPVSTLLPCILILFITRAAIGWITPRGLKDAIVVGPTRRARMRPGTSHRGGERAL